MSKLNEKQPRLSEWTRFGLVAVLLLGLMVNGLWSSGLAYAHDSGGLNQTSEQVSDLPALNNEFLDALAQYQKASENEKTSALNDLIETAKTRKQAMLAAAQTNPYDFLLSALPAGLQNKFPTEVLPYLEQEVSMLGNLNLLYVDYVDESKSSLMYQLKDTATGKVYNLHFAGNQPNLGTGSTIRVNGTKLDNELVSQNVTTVEAEVSGPTGDQHTLAMLINFTNANAQPWTPAQVAQQLFTDPLSTNFYYQDSSFQLTSFSGDVTNWMTVPYDNTDCTNRFTDWADAADQLATAAGWNLANYNRHLYVMSGANSCGWSGLSHVGGDPSRTWTKNNNSHYIFSHELGHAIGMMHASSIRCGTRAIDVYTSCTKSEYGDAFESMGNGSDYHNNGAHKVQQTWIPEDRVQTVTIDGTYSITPLEVAGTAYQVIKIAKPNTTEDYYLEYRQPIGFDSTLIATMTAGVGLHIAGPPLNGYPSNTYRVDTTPGDGSWANSPLSDGRTFQDAINGITITQLSHSASEATVQVTFGPVPCIKSAPGITLTPVSQTGSAGQTLNYTVRVTNYDTETCPSTSFNITASGLPAGFTSSSPTVTVPVGSFADAILSITSPAGVANGQYNFTAAATDVLDSTHTNSIQGTYIAFTDITPPVVTINQPANGTRVKGNFHISTTAYDNVAVASIVISIDGTAIQTCSNRTTCSTNYQANRLSSGNHTLSARATDSSNNFSTSSITIIK